VTSSLAVFKAVIREVYASDKIMFENKKKEQLWK